MTSTHELTHLLQNWSNGDQEALKKLTPIVYKELRRLAGNYMRREHTEHTLQPTALINEAFIRLINWKSVEWQNRAHFFGMAAQMMRHILVDYAKKRPRGVHLISFDEALVTPRKRPRDLVALDEALQRLAIIDPRKSKIVELRFFGGLGIKEIAAVLGLSTRTILREWNLAQVWLYRELTKDGEPSR
jgi:RNA polymerase sigma factor (TIGR02999 family)